MISGYRAKLANLVALEPCGAKVQWLYGTRLRYVPQIENIL
jgi:hypothetical protein